jgi:hypothetical protein
MSYLGVRQTVNILFTVSGAIGVTHTAFSAKKEHDRLNKLAADFADRRRIKRPIFEVGSIEEQITDTVETGDLVLFSRRWYNYIFPSALLITLEHRNGSQYDHVGVVVRDEMGVPHILENTMFSGYKLRRFDERIAYSKAKMIAYVPVQPQLDLNQENRKIMFEKAQFLARNPGGCEMVDMCRDFFATQLSAALACRFAKDIYHTQSIFQVFYIHSFLGFSLMHKDERKRTEVIQGKSFEKNKVLIECAKDVEMKAVKAITKGENAYKFGEITMLKGV